MGYATVKDLSELLKDNNYSKYDKKKQKIKEKYPKDIFPNHIPEGYKMAPNRPPTEEQRELYKEYLKEIGDLLFEPKGDYQKFCWDYLTSGGDKIQMERKAKGSTYGGKSYY